MKAEELRIGNIVFADAVSELLNEPMVIKGISCNEMYGKHYVMIYRHGSDRLSCTYYPMIHTVRPIPLTEEILLKCGFEKSPLDSSEFSIGAFECIIKEDGFGAYFKLCWMADIKYLHQLQNLYYAIKGEELKVNLL